MLKHRSQRRGRRACSDDTWAPISNAAMGKTEKRDCSSPRLFNCQPRVSVVATFSIWVCSVRRNVLLWERRPGGGSHRLGGSGPALAAASARLTLPGLRCSIAADAVGRITAASCGRPQLPPILRKRKYSGLLLRVRHSGTRPIAAFQQRFNWPRKMRRSHNLGWPTCKSTCGPRYSRCSKRFRLRPEYVGYRPSRISYLQKNRFLDSAWPQVSLRAGDQRQRALTLHYESVACTHLKD